MLEIEIITRGEGRTTCDRYEAKTWQQSGYCAASAISSLVDRFKYLLADALAQGTGRFVELDSALRQAGLLPEPAPSFDRLKFLARMREQFHGMWVPGSHYYSGAWVRLDQGAATAVDEDDCPICHRILLAAIEATGGEE